MLFRSDRVMLDEVYGLCPQVKPPQSGRHYPSLPYWLARRRQRREALGEELRLLYVALTRARDTLLLFGTVPEQAATVKWPEAAAHAPGDKQILSATHYLDWLGPWLTSEAGAGWTEQGSGECGLWRWRVYGESASVISEPAARAQCSAGEGARVVEFDEGKVAELVERMRWRYPFEAATCEPAKASVTALRRSAADESEAKPAPFVAGELFAPHVREQGPLNAADIGTAHHRFLQWLRLDCAGSAAALADEADRLAAGKILSDAERKALNLPALARFWQAEVGRNILAEAERVRRELPFTLRVSREALAEVPFVETIPEGEFVVVQGVADLVVIRPEELWLLDFKTDRFAAAALEEKTRRYAPQLNLYALALEQIYRRPVTRRWLHFLALEKTVAV